jgi:hypothetical protein
MTQHPRLMSPLKLRDQTLRNRIVFGAHTANMSDQGMPGPRFGLYFWNAPWRGGDGGGRTRAGASDGGADAGQLPAFR